MGRGEHPAGQGGGGRQEWARYRARAVRTASVAAPAPIRSRWRSQLAVEGTGWPRSAPAAPRPSTAASRRSHWPSRRSSQPPQRQELLGQGAIGELVQVLSGQLAQDRWQPGQPVQTRQRPRRPQRGRRRWRPQPVRLLGTLRGRRRMGVRVHGGNLSTPPPNTTTTPKTVDNRVQ
jgi:hypothetical protein